VEAVRRGRPRFARRNGAGAVRRGRAWLIAWASAWALPFAGRGDDTLFKAPDPGSYALPPIQRVHDRALLAPDGARIPLLGLAAHQAALVAFIYRRCSDAAGCPLALATLKRVDAALAQRPALASRVQLVTVSFDPARDTPPRMGELARELAPRSGWRFLTAASQAELAPVLADFGQDATPLVSAQGQPLGAIRHMVKLYLVDAHGDVRNIYSTSLLSLPLLLADLETVLALP
jgi:cytochrome oxidase Cu insertion factor (SCO1/SenC/PrrC family)